MKFCIVVGQKQVVTNINFVSYEDI